MIGLVFFLGCGLLVPTPAQFVYPDDSSCRTVRGTPGVCINLKTCPGLLNLLQQKPLTEQAIKYLKESQCGFDGPNEPKVCCDSSPSTRPTPPPPTADPGSATSPPNVSSHPNLRLLDHARCGPINRDKIIGGNRTRVNEFPWMALLQYRVPRRREPQFLCGGTVITNRYILTAAHCVTAFQNNQQLIGVRVGEHDLTKEIDCDPLGSYDQVCAEKYQDFGIEDVLYHQEYSPTKLNNDIALVRVNRVIDFRPENAKPICLPIGPAARITTKKLEVTGWGATESGRMSDVMLKVSLPIYPMSECEKIYKGKAELWHKQICMGGERGKDSCSGDSGGPLQGPAVYSGKPRYVQYGVVSFGPRNCGVGNFPGVYTKVEYYLDWILNNLKD